MLFNSIDFAIFLPIVFILYWYVFDRNLKQQNFLIVVSSYVFYGWWDWRFLILILFSTIIDYSVGLGLLKQENLKKRKILLWISILANLGILGFFKYYNFFLENFITAFSFFGTDIKASSLHLILPVGISFYTFQTLSYSIDIYKRKLHPTKDFIAFSAFVSFFPQLVAGPIERAKDLLPQFYKKRNFSYSNAVDGLRQILWGLFKKMVIADNCAMFANQIFNDSYTLNGSSLVLGVLFFTVQIYADFSGYSDIAIGISRLFGFNLMKNFSFPYFSRNMSEVWKRWHISLTTWFRDYLYIPLAIKNKSNRIKLSFILIFQFLIIGLWHGANWKFVAWGAIHALFMLPSTIYRKNKKTYRGIVAENKLLPSLKETLNILKVFILINFSMIFFRANNIVHAFDYISNIFSNSLFSIPDFYGKRRALTIVLITFIFFAIEWVGRNNEYAIEKLGLKWKRYSRLSFYYLIIILIFIYKRAPQEYIYFQF